MASSVASERAFSSAGITICKRRNRLDGDIVEALQCLKSLIHQDMMIRVFPSVADEEVFLDHADNQLSNQEGSASEAVQNAEDWTWEAIAEDKAASVDDNDDADDDVS
jgi:hAT family C-terminal dimerisation region